MKKKFSLKDHSSVLVGLLLGFSIIGAISISIIGSSHVGGPQLVRIGNAVIPLSSVMGVLQTFSLMLCIIMGCVDCVVGARLAYFVGGYMFVSSIVGMIRTRNLEPLPGLFNCIMALIAVVLIGHLMRKARKKSITDYATGTLNNIGFLEYLTRKIKDKKQGSLVYYQINNFRAINDDYGHDTGDKVLKITAARMNKVIGKDGVVGRIGGSEFAILIDGRKDANELIGKMFDSLNEKMIIDNGEFHLDCYIESNAGIACFPKDSNDVTTLFKCADVALMQSMKNGGNQICVFDENMQSRMHYEKEIEQLIKKASDEKYFYLEYQPQFSISDKSLRGFEALIRMKLPDGRKISPGEFIPVAEKSNLIFSIDEYVLDFVTREFAKVINESKEKVTISVNISANGISRPEFVSIVETSLRKNNFKAENLEIEITEYSFEESQEQTVKNIKKLKEMGVQVALDDFGTGYASLARLMNLSVDLLKVDKSLVDNVEKGEVNRDFINSIGSMGHLLDCKVILEGVETDSQLEFIKNLDCDYVQGYVWGKPMSYKNAKELIG
ncbi:MAG: bifunctional diguanylate cyclase/phosphodiesterase [Lachnospiraceae bacterium]|nr:bifunctional diguanylate cyclase/phosphodiesterase [Lachnospiraceae bacterium]